MHYDEEMVVSHNANEIRSTPVPATTNIPLLADNCQVAGINEAQFFDDEMVAIYNNLTNKGICVVIAGLDMGFKGNPFSTMPLLMTTGEYVTKVCAVCMPTGNIANYSFKKADTNQLVLLDESEEYKPLSHVAFYKTMLKEKVKQIDVNVKEVNSKKKVANG